MRGKHGVRGDTDLDHGGTIPACAGSIPATGSSPPAEKVGRSGSWLSKLENGWLPLDRMSVVGQLAEVLGVEVVELTGQPYRHETTNFDARHAAVPGLRLALR
ncbi:helix-turn-helix transcriptional regulator [Nonomuraea sp. NPDC050680]|uniref:helix-turn-helix domain-containing protein n=1 Tax=Nonomuraea sp. NPDC050680 TaxID=3154630 RepID=UPI0033FBA7F6